jgi:hypothetical protein
MSPEIGFLLPEFDAASDYRANARPAPCVQRTRKPIGYNDAITHLHAREGRGGSRMTVRPCDSISDLNFSRECS